MRVLFARLAQQLKLPCRERPQQLTRQHRARLCGRALPPASLVLWLPQLLSNIQLAIAAFFDGMKP